MGMKNAGGYFEAGPGRGPLFVTATLLFGLFATSAFGQPEKRVNIVPDRLEVDVWLDAETYRIGDPMVVSFRTNLDAYVTIFDIATDGSAVRLFPNRYDQSNRVQANQAYRIPGPGYDLRIGGPPGIGRLEVYASTDPRHGLRHSGNTAYQDVSETERSAFVKRVQVVPSQQRDSVTVTFRVAAADEDRWQPGEGFVTQCYEALLKRPPSRQEAAAALELLHANAQKQEAAARLLEDLLGSDEYFLRSVYRSLLGREAEPSGLEFYLRQLQERRTTRHEVIVGIVGSEEFRRRPEVR